MNKQDPHRKKLVAKLVARGLDDEQLITQLCEKGDMTWQEAEDLLQDFKMSRRSLFDTTIGVVALILLGSVAVGLVFVIVHLLLEGMNKVVASDLPDLLSSELPVFVWGFILSLFAVVMYSLYENATKEQARCPHCGYLVNRRGHERAIFFPRFYASTYYAAEDKLLTSYEDRSNLWQGEGWDRYAEFETSEICRRCRQARRKIKGRRRVKKYRQQEENKRRRWWR